MKLIEFKGNVYEVQNCSFIDIKKGDLFFNCNVIGLEPVELCKWTSDYYEHPAPEGVYLKIFRIWKK